MDAVLPNVIFSKHPDMPMKALWEALNGEALVGPEVAMAIVNDPRCGIERRSEVKEGAMQNMAINFTLNTFVGGATPLILAALAGRDDVMEAFLSLNPSVDANEDGFGYIALHLSSAMNNVSAIELLMANGSDVETLDIYGRTPLHMAALFSKGLEGIELLLDNGSNLEAVDKNGHTPLHAAVVVGNIEAFELLVANGSDVEDIENFDYSVFY